MDETRPHSPVLPSGQNQLELDHDKRSRSRFRDLTLHRSDEERGSWRSSRSHTRRSHPRRSRPVSSSRSPTRERSSEVRASRSRIRNLNKHRASRSRSRFVDRDGSARRKRYRSPSIEERKKSRYDSHNTQDITLQLSHILKNLVPQNIKEQFSNTNVIPEFNPSLKSQTINTWLVKVNECKVLYGWSERQTIHYALPKLVGVAKRWYEGLQSVLFTWSEWQAKLRAAFPAQENYGQMLADMIDKRAKFGESLEDYFYDKMALINRCEIEGKKAVECILHGIDDRSVRLGAEAVQFSDPDKLLAYLRNVKPRQIDKLVNKRGSFNDNKPKKENPNLRCYNCKESGHPFTKCQKPVKKCTICSQLGHLSEQCFRNKNNTREDKS